MCGIFAYLNYNVPKDRKYILEVLFNGLRRLEYRGYDSAGVSIDGFSDNSSDAASPLILKAQGKIDNLVASVTKTVEEISLDINSPVLEHAGIAHTRWATHGKPETRNSHPHTSGSENEFVVVHNGIITNHDALKQMLQAKGFVFESATDTEVIPKLAKYLYDRRVSEEGKEGVDFHGVVSEVVENLEGAFALVFKSRHFPGELVACRRGSPLILGIKEHSADKDVPIASMLARMSIVQGVVPGKRSTTAAEYFFASDASAVVEHTKSVLVLEDDDLAHVCDGLYAVYRIDREGGGGAPPGSKHTATHDRRVETLQMEVHQIMKGGYDHFMQKEIHEQPESLKSTMRGRVRVEGTENSDINSLVTELKAGRLQGAAFQGKVKLGGITPEVSRIIRRSRRIVFVACGTSYNAALAARQTVEELVEVPVSLELASDLLDRSAPVGRDDTIVVVSQSGETADTLEALKYVQESGAFSVGITNTVGSAISRGTECGVHINAGNEIGVASTKAYTSQIVAITMMALVLSEDFNSKAEKRQDIIRGLLQLPESVRGALSTEKKIVAIAKELLHEESLLLFGRGYHYATALEGALKVKEVSLMHSEGILAGEMKHGPLALVDEKLPLVVISTRDRLYTRMKVVIQQLHARNARLIVICNEDDEEIGTMGIAEKHLIRVPWVVDSLQAVVNIVPLQLLSYHLTCMRGHNVDQPRNLAKSVTVQ